MTEHWSARVAEALGAEVHDDFGLPRADVPPQRWPVSVRTARDDLGCTFFDWLTAVDELMDGFRLVCHLMVPPSRSQPMRQLMVRTLLPRADPLVGSVAEVFPGAAWHEREVAEMFGVVFAADGEPTGRDRLLLPEPFDGHPLRKEFVLASRVAEPWPGAKEPGESDASLAGRSGGNRSGRRRSRPPGVPEPDEWGPRPPGSPAPDPLAAAARGRRPRRGGTR